MKKFLSIILSVVMALSITISPVTADTATKPAIGSNLEEICVIDFGAMTSSLGNEPKITLAGMTTGDSFVDTDGTTYPALSQEVEPITKEAIIKNYPHLEHANMNNSYMKWTKNLASAMFRVSSLLPENTIKSGEKLKVTMEICLTDIVDHVEPEGSTVNVPVDNDQVETLFQQISLRGKNPSNNKDTDKFIISSKVAINQWTTISGYFTVPSIDDSVELEKITALKFDPKIQGDKKDCVTSPFAKTVFIGKLTFERIVNNNIPIREKLNYSDSFENIYVDKLPHVTPIMIADKGVWAEGNLASKDTANSNSINDYEIKSNGSYKYTSPKSTSVTGKYALFGDATLGDTGCKDATFGIGIAGIPYKTSTDNHLSAADRLEGKTDKTSTFNVPSTPTGNKVIVASGLYNKNASVRFNNIFGSHPVKEDVGRKYIVSYKVYADSTMGAYTPSDKDYTSATPVTVDKTKPVSLTTSFNGPLGVVYKNSTGYNETKLSVREIPWDEWTEIKSVCEITTEGIDNLSLEKDGNLLKNCIQVSQFNAVDQIADTLYFDDFSVEELEIPNKATISAYLYDGAYDITAKITKSEETTVQLIVGEYEVLEDGSLGQLVSLRSSLPKTFNSAALPVSLSVTNYKPFRNNTTLRAFLIDSYTGLCPYLSPVNVKDNYTEIN